MTTCKPVLNATLALALAASPLACKLPHSEATVKEQHGAEQKTVAVCGSQVPGVTNGLSEDTKRQWATLLADPSVTDYTQYEQMRQTVKAQTGHDILTESLAGPAPSPIAGPEDEEWLDLGSVALDPCYSGDAPVPDADSGDAPTASADNGANEPKSFRTERSAGHFRVSHNGVLTKNPDQSSNYNTTYKTYIFGHSVNLGSTDLTVTTPYIESGAGVAPQAALQAVFFGIDAIVNKKFTVSDSFELQQEVTLLGLLVNMSYVDLDFAVEAYANIGAKAEIVTKLDTKPVSWSMAINPIFSVTILLRGAVTPTFAPRVVSGGLIGELILVDAGATGLFAQGLGGKTYTWVNAAVTLLAGDISAEVYFRFWRASWRVTYNLVKWGGYTLAKSLGTKPGADSGSGTQPVQSALHD